MPARVYLLQTPPQSTGGVLPFPARPLAPSAGVCATLAAQSRALLGRQLLPSPGKRAALAGRARLAARSAWQGKRLFISSPSSRRDTTPGKMQESFHMEQEGDTKRYLKRPEGTKEPLEPGCLSSLSQEPINKIPG